MSASSGLRPGDALGVRFEGDADQMSWVEFESTEVADRVARLIASGAKPRVEVRFPPGSDTEGHAVSDTLTAEVWLLDGDDVIGHALNVQLPSIQDARELQIRILATGALLGTLVIASVGAQIAPTLHFGSSGVDDPASAYRGYQAAQSQALDDYAVYGGYQAAPSAAVPGTAGLSESHAGYQAAPSAAVASGSESHAGYQAAPSAATAGLSESHAGYQAAPSAATAGLSESHAGYQAAPSQAVDAESHAGYQAAPSAAAAAGLSESHAGYQAAPSAAVASGSESHAGYQAAASQATTTESHEGYAVAPSQAASSDFASHAGYQAAASQAVTEVGSTTAPSQAVSSDFASHAGYGDPTLTSPAVSGTIGTSEADHAGYQAAPSQAASDSQEEGDGPGAQGTHRGK